MTDKINIPFIPGEIDVFNFINSHHSSFGDSFMFLISFKYSWIPLLVCFLIYIFYNKKIADGLFILVMIAICIILGDQVSSGISKPLFSRLRPTHFPEIKEYVKTVYGYEGGLYGFFSSHACNFVAVFSFLSLTIKDKWTTIILLFYGFLVCYSRIYLGVHFLSDILVGVIIGIIIGFLVYKLFKYTSSLAGLHSSNQSIYKKNIVFFRFSLVLFMLTLIAYSIQVEKIVNVIS